MILARPVGFSQAGWRERETVSGIVIVLACDREKMLIVVKLDLAYEKVWKHSVSRWENPTSLLSPGLLSIKQLTG